MISKSSLRQEGRWIDVLVLAVSWIAALRAIYGVLFQLDDFMVWLIIFFAIPMIAALWAPVRFLSIVDKLSSPEWREQLAMTPLSAKEYLYPIARRNYHWIIHPPISAFLAIELTLVGRLSFVERAINQIDGVILYIFLPLAMVLNGYLLTWAGLGGALLLRCRERGAGRPKSAVWLFGCGLLNTLQPVICALMLIAMFRITSTNVSI